MRPKNLYNLYIEKEEMCKKFPSTPKKYQITIS